MVMPVLTTEAPPAKTWIVCRGCNFGMECASDIDALEIAAGHLKSYHHGSIDFYYDRMDFRRAMADKPLPSGYVYPQDHVKHRQAKLL